MVHTLGIGAAESVPGLPLLQKLLENQTRVQAEMPLYRIAYKSTVGKQITKAEIRQILASSENNNQRDNLTGALLFNSGVFLQILEGRRAKINRLLERLSGDPRHKEIEYIGLEPIADRIFPKWSMALIEDNSVTRGILLKYCGVDKPDVEALGLAEVTEMMLQMLGQSPPAKAT